ncbi:MAG: glycosyltransferase family 2 protein [candidate division NC10 bacterium]|nr:glycosyltransferase family 2 protein [candidate division NC10 bacterium]
MEAPFVSVVVPTYNRARLLRDSLRSLVAQDYPHDRYEIVVVDDGSTDETQAATEEARLRSCRSRILYVRQDHRGLNAARNAGIQASHGDPICFVDDDIDAPPGWLSSMVEGVLRHSDSGCFGGPVRLRLEGRPPRNCGRHPLGETELDLGNKDRPIEFVWGANFTVTRKALSDIGPFDERIVIYGDEQEWEERYKSQRGVVWYIASAWLWHRRLPEDLALLRMLQRRFSRGANQVLYLRMAGQDISACRALSAIPLNVGHSLKRGCAGGLLTAATLLGHAWGAIRRG